MFVFSFVGMVKADIAPPSELTTFYFQKNGQPFTWPVNFTVKCYGKEAMVGDKILKISEISETCQTYGCKFDTSNAFEVYAQNTDYCDLEGEVDGEKFTIKDFLVASASEMNGLSCNWYNSANTQFSGDDRYYKETPQYKDCMGAVNKEYPPDHGPFCYKFLQEALKSECGKPGYLNLNGGCYRATNESYQCEVDKIQKEKLCRQYLEDVSSKIVKDKDGYPFNKICETKINLPANISNKQQPQIERAQVKSIFIQIINFFRCPFRKLWGRFC